MKKLITSIICILSVTILFAISNKDWEIINTGTEDLNGYVYSLAHDDNNNLYFGGDFMATGDIRAEYVGGWDGSSWFSVGLGPSNFVQALIVDSLQNLYAGGRYGGGVTKWDGNNWTIVGGGVNLDVMALAIDKEGNLYAGGWFTRAGGVTARHVAKWDGSSWSPLGSGMRGTDYAVVNALAFDNEGNLYAGGIFTSAGGVAAKNIAKWDGTQWSPLANGLPHVMTIACDSKGIVYAGGEFRAGSRYNISKFDGNSWSGLGSGSKKPVYDIEIDEYDNVYVGSYSSYEENVRFIGKWDGTVWSSLGTGVNKGVIGMDYHKGRLYVGGCYTIAGGKDSPYLASVIVNPSNVVFMNGRDFSIDPARGTQDQLIGRFILSVDKVIGHLNEVNISITGIRNGLSNFKLWKSTDNIFDPSTDRQLDSTITEDPGIGNDLKFSGFSSLLDTTGIYYFFTCDIASNASGTFKAELRDDNSLVVCGGEFGTPFENEPMSSKAVSYPADLSLIVQDAASRIDLSYGWSDDASDDFDSELDQYAPVLPSADSLDARFSINGKDYISDYRESITIGEYIVWDLHLQTDSSNTPVVISWDHELFPVKGSFTLQDTAGTIKLDMRSSNQIVCHDPATNLQIVYALFRSDFDVDTSIGDLPLTVQFSDISTGDINSWYWQFGDGNTSTEQNPVHTYYLKGNYTVSLTVEDGSNTHELIKADLIIVDNPENAYITNVFDVPDDQGGWVSVDFLPSKYDTGDADSNSVESYSIELNNGNDWITTSTLEANTSQNYSTTVQTPLDSSASSSGLLNYRVVANLNDRIYISNIVGGYSLDNIAPATPSDFSMIYLPDAIQLDWSPVLDPDFYYYGIYRSINDDFHAIVPIIYARTFATTFTDTSIEEGKNYYYRVVAIDIHENESEPTETVCQYTNIDHSSNLPKNFELLQNYPNPFNPQTTLRYGIPEVSDIKLIIYDIMGRKIKEWDISSQSAGWHEIVWNGTNNAGQGVSTGVYIYMMQAGDFIDTKKMVFMK